MAGITTRVYRDGVEVACGPDLDPLAELDADSGRTVWVDLEDAAPDRLERLGKQLGLHPLAVEDALGDHQRDKWAHYPNHLFLVAHAAELDADAGVLRTTELDVFIGDRWLVTVHGDGGALIARVDRHRNRAPDLAATGIGYLVYGLLDEIVDGYATVLDRFEKYYDTIAEQVFADQPIGKAHQRQWFAMRRALTRFDRIINPLHEGLGPMVQEDIDRFPAAASPYLRDVASEVKRAALEVDALRELVAQIIETEVSLRDLRQNTVMKRVTSWAAIIAVPTLVTGWYGMNVPYPGSQQTSGVVVAGALSLGIAGTLYVLFKRKEWL
jgi:magnesium transporter